MRRNEGGEVHGSAQNHGQQVEREAAGGQADPAETHALAHCKAWGLAAIGVDRALQVLRRALQRSDVRCVQAEDHSIVVSDVTQAEPEASAHLEAHVQASHALATESPDSTSLPIEAFVRYYPRQEPSALAAHAGICAGGAG